MNKKFNIVFASKMNVHNRRTEILNSYSTLYKEYAFSVRSIWMYAQVSVKFTLISCVLFFVKKLCRRISTFGQQQWTFTSKVGEQPNVPV